MSRKSVIRRLLLISILFVVSAAIAYPRPANWVVDQTNKLTGLKISEINKPFVLGLDLQGGTRLEYSADVSKVDASEQRASLEGVRDVIERRVNSIGVSEPLVQIAQAGDEWRVSVELAGIRDINQAIKLIGETPILEFKEENNDPPRSLTVEEKKKMSEDNAKALKSAQDALAAALKDPAAFDGQDLGFIKDNPEYLEIYDAVKADSAGVIHPQLISTPRNEIVAKVEEVKTAGTEIHAYHILIPFAGATNSTSTATKDEARRALEEVKKQTTPQNFIDLAKKYSQEPNASQTGGDLGWFGKNVMVPAFEEPAFKLEKGQISEIIETQFGYHLIYKPDERPLNDVRVKAKLFKKTLESDIIPPREDFKNTLLTGKNLKRAQLDFDQRSGSAQVSLVFDDEGAKLFAEITKRNINKRVAIYLDGQPISVPTVNSEITGGQAVISGSFTVTEAKILAQRLTAGALPIPINLIAQQSVGPTLGQDSIDASMIAGLWGFLFVALFMLAFYRLPGVFAIVTLGLYAAMSMTIFKLLPVTLSLSGIAGFILSIGIAVDANVLVFERLKEELRLGKSLRNALDESFRRAWPAIRDGNYTTLISCAVLYWFTSSVIKGFALTLAIGVILSMFTAIVATRALLRYVSGFAWAQNNSWLFPGAPKKSDQQK